MILLLAWLVCFRPALLAGAALGLTLSLAFVPSADPSIVASRLSNPTPLALAAEARRTDLDGSAVRASAGTPISGLSPAPTTGLDTNGARLARTTTRSRGNSGQHVPETPERATSTASVPSSEGGTTSPPIPSSAPRALVVARGSPATVVRDENDVELAVIEASREFGVDGALLLCVARAESGFRTDLLGHSGERGPMQFMPRTWGYFDRDPDGTARWTGNSARLGYGEQDVWLAIPAARVAASMWARGQQGAWSTYAGCAR